MTPSVGLAGARSVPTTPVPPPGTTALVVDGVTVGYRGREVLREVGFALGSGVHLLLGANGAGKTTLLRTLTGVLTPERGTVSVDGVSPHHGGTGGRHIGLAGHRAGLAPLLSVRDNVEYWARLLGLPAAVRARRVDQVLDQLSLGPLADRPARELSRGQTQRVSLAKALIGEPSVLLLDEPLSGIDPGIVADLRQQLRQLADEGVTVLLSAHELEEVADLADDLLLLRAGRILAHGRPAEVRARLLGEERVVRLRGTPGLAAALAAYGVASTGTPDGAVHVRVTTEDEVPALVARLVGDGVGVVEVRPAESDLTAIYRALHDQAESS